LCFRQHGRGTAEHWVKEGKNAVKWMRLSCHDFVDNQVRLELFALAYNLGNFLRRLLGRRLFHHYLNNVHGLTSATAAMNYMTCTGKMLPA